MHRTTGFSLFLWIVFLLMAASAAAGEHFHAPRSAAEKALADILWASDYDRGFLDYLFADANRDPKKDRLYAPLVSKGLRAALGAHEKGLPKDVCDGHFRSGRICGYDANPLTCRKDVGEYLYATREKGKAGTIIALVSEGQLIPDDRVVYKIVRQDARWKLDGVFCPGGPKFNFREKEKKTAD